MVLEATFIYQRIVGEKQFFNGNIELNATIMKALLVFFPIVLVVAGCSGGEEPVQPQSESSNEIGFYATAPKGSRAASTTTATLQNFVVYAYTEASVVMDGVTVSRDGGSWTYSPAVYWPAYPVDFYAVSPDMKKGGDLFSDGEEVIHGVEYGSTDLLYAVALDEIERPAPVSLTFRHAMSQVSILLSSTSNKYIVEVYHVSVNNISLSGDFTYPQQNTSEDGATGSWSNLSASASALLYYDVDGNPALLTTTPRNLTEGNLESSFFVPQNLETLKYVGTSGFVGSYMQIDCIIKDKATGEKIWPNEYTPKYLLVQATECGRMLFPLSTPDVTSWQQGYSYVYNVVIDHTYSIDKIEFAPIVKDYIESNPY